MNLEETKEFLKQFPKDKRIEVLGILYDNGLIEQREYSIQELAEMTGYSRMHMNEIFTKALNKCKTIAEKKELYYG
jgi:hypothetical protein